MGHRGVLSLLQRWKQQDGILILLLVFFSFGVGILSLAAISWFGLWCSWRLTVCPEGFDRFERSLSYPGSWILFGVLGWLIGAFFVNRTWAWFEQAWRGLARTNVLQNADGAPASDADVKAPIDWL